MKNNKSDEETDRLVSKGAAKLKRIKIESLVSAQRQLMRTQRQSTFLFNQSLFFNVMTYKTNTIYNA